MAHKTVKIEKFEVGQILIIRDLTYGRNPLVMKIKITGLTKTTLVWCNLDNSFLKHKRDTIIYFLSNYEIEEIVETGVG